MHLAIAEKKKRRSTAALPKRGVTRRSFVACVLECVRCCAALLSFSEADELTAEISLSRDACDCLKTQPLPQAHRFADAFHYLIGEFVRALCSAREDIVNV